MPSQTGWGATEGRPSSGGVGGGAMAREWAHHFFGGGVDSRPNSGFKREVHMAGYVAIYSERMKALYSESELDQKDNNAETTSCSLLADQTSRSLRTHIFPLRL